MSNENIHRLEGTGNSSGGGGLVVRKKKAEDQDEFKVPKVSLLGLDKLAAIKEKERRELEGKSDTDSKRFKLIDKGNAASDDRRQFRKYSDETPTHTGGVAREAYEKRKERERREKERGLLVTSKEGRKDRERDRDRHGRHDRHEKSRSSHRGEKDKDRDRKRKNGQNSERHHRGSSRSNSTRERDSGWDFDTPR